MKGDRGVNEDITEILFVIFLVATVKGVLWWLST